MLVPSLESAKTTYSPPSEHRLIPSGLGFQFFLVTGLFFLWGIPNNLNDVLIRQFMTSFALSRFQAGLVQSAFYMGYFVLAIPAALLMRRFGYKAGFISGLSLFGGGCFLFWPAAVIGRYSFFLLALFVIASGLAFLETASNPFAAQLGDPESAARRLNFAQAFNPLGSICGVLIGTVFIFSGIELSKEQIARMQALHTYHAYLRQETMRVVSPYIVLGAIVLVWALLIARTRFPTFANEHESADQDHGRFRELLRYPHLLLAAVVQFLYVGAQVGTWSYFIQYIQNSTHQPEKIAGYLLTGTLIAFAVGRFVSTELMKHVQPHVLMGLYGIVNVALVAVGIEFPGWIGLWAIFATSFFMSLMYPTIFALGIRGLGRNTKIGGSLIVMGIAGGAVLTPIMGLISEWSRSVAVAYTVPLLAYVAVALYSFFGTGIHRNMDEPGEHFATTA